MDAKIRGVILAALVAVVAMPAVGPVAAQDAGSGLLQEIVQATRLPTITREARGLGVPEEDLRIVFAAARENRVSAGNLAELLAEENEAVRKHGPINNFGLFVQERLRSGLRGRELAAAIRDEHAARGLGDKRPADAGQPGAQAGGKPDGKSDSPGKSGQADKDKKGGPR